MRIELEKINSRIEARLFSSFVVIEELHGVGAEEKARTVIESEATSLQIYFMQDTCYILLISSLLTIIC